jgi:DnaJ-domain-containing protein 1
VIDYFALLDEPRRPWLEPEELKARFLDRSAGFHPDRIHESSEAQKTAANQRFRELNSAYQCLRDDRERLAHLLELERGARPESVQAVPSGRMEMFFEIAQICRQTEMFLEADSKAASPLLKARNYAERLEWTDRLQALQQKMNIQREALLVELRNMNSFWENAPLPGSPERLQALPMDRLEEIYRQLSYLARGTAQAGEQLVQLSIQSP